VGVRGLTRWKLAYLSGQIFPRERIDNGTRRTEVHYGVDELAAQTTQLEPTRNPVRDIVSVLRFASINHSCATA
jgi:hypothetical protein